MKDESDGENRFSAFDVMSSSMLTISMWNRSLYSPFKSSSVGSYKRTFIYGFKRTMCIE